MNVLCAHKVKEYHITKGGVNVFCPKCGAQIPDGTSFCTSCGNQIGGQAPQQAYQQPVYQQPAPRPAKQHVQQEFTSKGIIATFLSNLTDPRCWGIPQFIALGASFLYFVAMIMPYVSVSGFGNSSSSYFSAGASSVIPAIFLLIGVCCVAFTKNGVMMSGIGLVAFFHTLFGGAAVSSAVSLSVGFVFMLLASIAMLGAGVFQLVLELQNK